MYSTQDIRNRVDEWDFEHFDAAVRTMNGFTTVIYLEYERPWAGELYDEVSPASNEYHIRYAHSTDEFQLLLPVSTCPNQAVPDTDEYTIDRESIVTHDSLDDLERELFDGLEYELGVVEWLPDYIERWRFQRFSEVLPGLGPVRIERLYNDYKTLAAVHAAPFDELDDRMRTEAAEKFEALEVFAPQR